jgi:hypothetical protein
MGSVVIDMSMSLDGYIAAPNEGVRDAFMWGRDGASGRGTPARQRSGTRPGPGAGARAAQRLRVGQMANRLLQQVHVAPAMPRTRISNRLMTSALLGRTSGGLACASRANGARAWPPAPLARLMHQVRDVGRVAVLALLGDVQQADRCRGT